MLGDFHGTWVFKAVLNGQEQQHFIPLMGYLT